MPNSRWATIGLPDSLKSTTASRISCTVPQSAGAGGGATTTADTLSSTFALRSALTTEPTVAR